MALPILETPSYELILPSTNKKVKYRPFLVKEYKILLTTVEADVNEITRIVTELVDNCTFNKLDISKLAHFDVEYLFLNIRGKSVGEEIEVNIICPDDEETNTLVKIDLDSIKVQKNEDHTNQIKIDSTIMMEMKYPSLEQFIKTNFDFKNDNTMDQSFDLISSCIDKIYTEEEVWIAADVTKKELIDFLEQLNSSQFKQIEKFFETMPRLSHKIKVTNPKTEVESEVILEGLASFFA